ncbi:MAG: hypothetical protein KAI03_03320 [Candidatus Aureabacteria bacterium]|nr:hypothetical protein [Candidatus Auribacterota bacterium]
MKRNIRSRKKKIQAKAPSIAQLGQQMKNIDCSHLVGKEVIEQQISDLVRGKLDASYCQNWSRCGNGWGKCSPDSKAWIEKIRKLDLDKVLSPAELKIVKNLKISKKG